MRDALPSPLPLDTTLTLDADQRPLYGHDIECFRARMGLANADMALAMCLLPGQYQQAVRHPDPLPLNQDILLRLYQHSPSPSSWQSWSPGEAFEAFYGPLMRSFVLPAQHDAARLMLRRRFAAVMGRSCGRAASWIDGSQGHSLSVQRILGKLVEFEAPRAVLEPLAARAHAVRGLDLEALAPLPTPEQGSRSRRGRPPKRTHRDFSPPEAHACAMPGGRP
jgi:hypothetical protein